MLFCMFPLKYLNYLSKRRPHGRQHLNYLVRSLLVYALGKLSQCSRKIPPTDVRRTPSLFVLKETFVCSIGYVIGHILVNIIVFLSFHGKVKELVTTDHFPIIVSKLILRYFV